MDTKLPVADSSKLAARNNIMTEDELNNMLSKGVKPKEEIKVTLTQFVRWRIQTYEQHKWRNLSDIFAEDFQQFVKEDFETLDKDTLYSLRDCLRANGVYIRKGRGVAASQALTNVVQQDIPWPEDDEERPPSKPQVQTYPQQQLYQQAQAQVAQVYPQQQARQQAQQQQPYTTPIAQLPPTPVYGPNQLPPTPPVYGPNHRIPHLLPSPHQIIQDFGIKQNHGHSKELTTLSQMYTSDAEKYGGNPTESLSYKFTIFMNLCKRAEIPKEILHTAFPTMLKSMALEYYYFSCQAIDLTIQQLFDRFEAYFEGEEHRRNMLREWNSINLRDLLRASPDKHKGTVFNEMIQQLRQVQRDLDYEFQSDTALRNKIISSCSNIPVCSAAVLQHTSTIAGLINNIYAAIENNEEAMKAERSEPLGLSTTYFTDRKYHINRPSSDNNRPSNNNRKQCFICGKQNCWSTKHTEKERQDARNKFAKRFSNIINKRYNLYVQEQEGIEDDEKDIDDMKALALGSSRD